MKQKIFTIEKLQDILEQKKIKKKIVRCHGVFDLVHPGHIRHLEAASRLGDKHRSLQPQARVQPGPLLPSQQHTCALPGPMVGAGGSTPA